MSQIYGLELTAAALPLDGLAHDVHTSATERGVLAGVDPPGAAPRAAELTLHSGLRVWVAEPFSSGTDPFIADFGLERAAIVDLQIEGTMAVGPQLDEMLVLVFDLLARRPGDAVLHFEYARVWFLRRDGRLVLNDDASIWTPERLARVPPPYERASLRFSDVPPS